MEDCVSTTGKKVYMSSWFIIMGMWVHHAIVSFVTTLSSALVPSAEVEVSQLDFDMLRTQRFYPWPSKQPAWRIWRLPWITILLIQPNKATVWIEILQLLSLCIHGLVAQAGCGCLLAAGITSLHVCGP